MRSATGSLARHPSALAIRCGDLAVQSRRELDVHERSARAHEVRELLVLPLEEGVSEDLDLNTRLAQKLQAATTHLGVGVQVPHHDPRNTGPQYGLRTRGGLAVVVAGFERHVQLCALGGGTRALQSPDLRVLATGAGVPSLPDDRAIAHHDRPHQRVRRRGVPPVLCELTGALHETVPSHSFLSPIRTLTVGAGIRLKAFTGSTPEVFVEGSRALREGLVVPADSPPVRELHPPPKVTNR